MRLSFTLIFALTATLVSSQSVSSLVAQLPSCAISCLASASSTVGCAISDYACQCGAKKSALTAAATPCVIKACSSTDALKTNGITGDICKAATQGPQTSASNPGSIASSIVPGTKPPATATSYAASTTTALPSSTSSSPAQVSGNAGTKVQGGVVAAGAVMLAAFAL